MSMSAGTGDTTCNFLTVFDELIFSMNSVSGFQLFCWDFYFSVRVFKINESPSLTLSQKSLFLFIKKIKKKSLCFLL